jgi:hypothetical protein
LKEKLISESELTKVMKLEEIVTRRRLEAIKEHGLIALKELSQKAMDTFGTLDEWNLERFNAEMKSISELLQVVREAIELEINLPQALVLLGEKFYVDLQLLMNEPETEARPPSPVEKNRNNGIMI